jgi:outer membrane biosynthesis protein TonB
MPEKIGSISSQWGTIGGKKTSKPAEVQEITPQEPQVTEQQNNQEPTVSVNQDPNPPVNEATKTPIPQTPRKPRTKKTRTSGVQTSSSQSNQDTNKRVVQYTREVKPERIRQTMYLYPEVLRWIKRRIAETDEEISDVGNYTAQLCMWLEEKYPHILDEFDAQQK